MINDQFEGPAGAIRSGIKNSSGDVVVVVAADGCDDASQISDLVRLVERGITVACASRYMHGGKLVNSPFLKDLLSRFANILLHFLRRIGTRDSTNNYKAYSRKFLESISIEPVHGFEIGLELTVKAFRAGLSIAEIPTIRIERDSGQSNFQ